MSTVQDEVSNNLEMQWLNAVSAEDFIHNNSTFNSLMMKYRCVIRQIETKLQVLNDEFSVANKRNPISSIKSRVKSPSSIHEKLNRRGFPFTEQSIVANLDDVAGVRVVCPFISDIYAIAQLISAQDDITVLKIKDYIKHPKDNGYRSFHMIVEVPVYFSDGKVPMRAEIQIRTIGMDFWASVDHQLHYKKVMIPGADVSSIAQALALCAETVNETDRRMEAIKELIGEFVVDQQL